MIRFGPSGNCDLFYDQGYKSSLDAPLWLKNRGLSAYEYSFSRGFTLGEVGAMELGKRCKEQDVSLSLHAPYYINFANKDPKMIEKSIGYVITSLKYAGIMGASRVVFHPGSCTGEDRGEAFSRLLDNIKLLVSRIDEEHFDFPFLLCPETMGKSNQIGTYKEVAEICQLAPYLVPTLDFGHINALTQGSLKGEGDFEEIIKFLIDKIGFDKVKKVHIHFSKIMYGDKGEIKHLTFEDNDYGPEFDGLAKVIKKYNLEPVIVCESRGTQSEDASEMKRIYELN